MSSLRISKVKLAVIGLILANIIWGASFPIYKWSLDNIPPFTFVFLRFFLAAFLILPFTLHNLMIEKKDFPKLILLSLVGITFSISFLFLGLQLSPSINAPIILSAGPVFLLLFSIFYLKENAKPKVITGTVISLLGVLLIIIRPLLEQGIQGSILGNSFFILTLLGNVAYVLLLKSLLPKYNPLSLTFWSFVIGSLPLLPMVFMESQTSGFLTKLDGIGLFGIFFGVVFAGAIAHYLHTFGIKHIATSEVGIFAYVDPIATVLVAIPLLGESITPTYILGAMFVFAGIFIAENRLHYHPFHKLKN